MLGSGDTNITEYAWDHRNRLTKVTERASFGGPATQTVDYHYDYLNQLVGRVVDPDGDTGSAAIDQTLYLYEEGQVALEFHQTGSGNLDAGDLAHRYLWGPAVDQHFADEQVGGETLWALTGSPKTGQNYF